MTFEIESKGEVFYVVGNLAEAISDWRNDITWELSEYRTRFGMYLAEGGRSLGYVDYWGYGTTEESARRYMYGSAIAANGEAARSQ